VLGARDDDEFLTNAVHPLASVEEIDCVLNVEGPDLYDVRKP
jgi:hypothetical protein